MSGATSINNPATGFGQGCAGMRFSLFMITGGSTVTLTFGNRYFLGATGSAGVGTAGGTYTLQANSSTLMSFMATTSGFTWVLAAPPSIV